MNRIARILLAAIVTAGVFLPPLLAAEQGQRYIVILKQRSGAAPDIAALGGTIELRQEDELIVTIPPSALAALRSDPKVRYVERVGGQPSPSEDSLVGVPSDPQPGAPTQARRLTPHLRRWEAFPGIRGLIFTTVLETLSRSEPTTISTTATRGSNSHRPRGRPRRTLTTVSGT